MALCCWKCRDAGKYRVARWSKKHDKFVTVRKLCTCAAGQKLAEWKTWSIERAKVGESA